MLARRGITDLLVGYFCRVSIRQALSLMVELIIKYLLSLINTIVNVARFFILIIVGRRGFEPHIATLQSNGNEFHIRFYMAIHMGVALTY